VSKLSNKNNNTITKTKKKTNNKKPTTKKRKIIIAVEQFMSRSQCKTWKRTVTTTKTVKLTSIRTPKPNDERMSMFIWMYNKQVNILIVAFLIGEVKLHIK
jgi:hypothetical protein